MTFFDPLIASATILPTPLWPAAYRLSLLAWFATP